MYNLRVESVEVTIASSVQKKRKQGEGRRKQERIQVIGRQTRHVNPQTTPPLVRLRDVGPLERAKDVRNDNSGTTNSVTCTSAERLSQPNIRQCPVTDLALREQERPRTRAASIIRNPAQAACRYLRTIESEGATSG